MILRYTSFILFRILLPRGIPTMIPTLSYGDRILLATSRVCAYIYVQLKAIFYYGHIAPMWKVLYTIYFAIVRLLSDNFTKIMVAMIK